MRQWARESTCGGSESGTIFWVPSTREIEVLNSSNPRLSGSFTANQTNYIGLDMKRSADIDTTDSAQFLDANTRAETGKSVPLARTLDYRIVVGTTSFSSQPTILPIAKVVTDSLNNVVSIEDARRMMFRLGSGGDFPDVQSAYTWPGTRAENLTGDVFAGGDKPIDSLKTWMDAVMSRLWDIGGGEYWYSATADRNVNMIWTGATFTNGENFEWDGTNLHWKGLKFLFDNSSGYYNDITNQTGNSAGLTDLADGECLYVDLDRTQNLTGGSALVAVKAPLLTLGASAVPGARQVLAWRIGSAVYSRFWRYPVGTTFIPATTTSTGVLKISRDYLGNVVGALSALNSPVAISDRGGTIEAVVGTNHVGLTITADGSGHGLESTGGASGGVGVRGFGGVNGVGGAFLGNGGGYGCTGRGGATDGSYGMSASVSAANATALQAVGAGTGGGAVFTGGATSGPGLTASGGGTGHGGVFTGGATNGRGVSATGQGSGAGVVGTGGATGIGGDFTGGATAGVRGIGGATVAGVVGGGGTSGPGGSFTGGPTDGTGITAVGGGAAGPGATFLGGTAGQGLTATGQGTGVGATITGGAAASAAVVANANAASNGHGVNAAGFGNGHGVNATTTTGTGHGVNATSSSGGTGASAVVGTVTGGSATSYGVKGSSDNGAGVKGVGTNTTVPGGVFEGGTNAYALIATATGGSSIGAKVTTGGAVGIETNGTVDMSTAPAIANGIGVTNKVTRDNVLKAFAVCTLGAAGAAPAILENFNITTIVRNVNVWVVTYAAAMGANPVFCVQAECGSNWYQAVPTDPAAYGGETAVGVFKMINSSAGNTAGGATPGQLIGGADTSLNSTKIRITVFGRQ
jgi:hypothetical protein